MTALIGLYLHIPFCRQRCDFCAFYLEVYREPAAEAFLRALKTECRLQGGKENIAGRDFQSVYFGGGTPTTLRASELITILADVRQTFSLEEDPEITIEAHPGTVARGDLAALREAGFNRINLDLMYGLPHQTLGSWRETLYRCIALGPTHLSCYALTVEEGTRLAHDIRHKHRQAPDESLQITMDQAAQTLLSDAGYHQYEISNYARPGFECSHNLLYWTQGDYLGLGPSAQSFARGVRFGNVANLTAYQAALAEGRLPIQDWSTLTEQEQVRDAVIFGLRLIQGIPTHQLRTHAKNYGHAETLKELLTGELIEEDGERSRLSAQGRLHADTIAEKLF